MLDSFQINGNCPEHLAYAIIEFIFTEVAFVIIPIALQYMGSIYQLHN